MDPVLRTEDLALPWPAPDPFLFCMFHLDAYPAGNAALGPAAPLAGRAIGQDFDPGNPWRMYHGSTVPGFPAHPHRGFETVTVVTRGYVDHADSLGAAGRYGAGDTQWLTAGRGVQHAEMFPLLNRQGDNTLELFQIWLNLPASHKLAEPHFRMLWREQIPVVGHRDAAGRATRVTLVAGQLEGQAPPAPPPNSWAADPAHGLAIWLLRLEPGAECRLPAAAAGLNRKLYFYRGESLEVAGHRLSAPQAAVLQSDAEAAMNAGEAPAEALLLQGRPIGEPVSQYGPFVMNTRTEIQQAFADYQRDRFGGWPWPRPDPVHGDSGRFARHADGREEVPRAE